MQRLQADAEHLGGARLVAAGGIERGHDQLLLGFIHRHARRDGQAVDGSGGGGREGAEHRQVRWLDDIAFRQDRARSMTLRSSRTLPGHSYWSSSFIAAGDTVFTSRLSRALNSSMNAWISSGKSSLRSRSGGSEMVNTLSR